MGGAKVKTGIKVVDDAANTVIKAGSDAGNAINQGLSTGANNINRVGSDAGNSINRGISGTLNSANSDLQGAATNIERNGQNIAKGWARVFSGDFNNFDRTLLDTAGAWFTGGASLAVNPDDTTRVTGKEPAIQRMEKEAETAAADEAAAAARAAAAASVRSVAETISGQVGARMRAPGRNMTLLGGGSSAPGNTLLTIRG